MAVSYQNMTQFYAMVTPFTTIDNHTISGNKVLTTIITSWFTSSTAQGGGGSFENMKPIGEVGCCDSRMAERIH